MSHNIEIYTDVTDAGVLRESAIKTLKRGIPLLKSKHVRIRIEVVSKTRSSQENRYYWSGYLQSQIDCFLERWGEIWTKEECHTWNKNNIWGTEFIDEETGVIYKKPGSSATKKTTEFELCLEKGRQFFFTNFDWVIPMPNEQLTINE